MRMKYFMILALPLLLLSSVPSNAQFIDQGFGGGMTIGGSIGQTGEQDNSRVGTLVRAYLRQGFARHFTAELGVSSTKIYGKEYYSNMLPWEVKALYSPFDLGKWNFYLSAGFGAARIWQYSVIGDLENRDDVMAIAFIPAGIGVQTMVGKNIALEARAGYNYGLGDWISPDRDDKADSWLTFSAGFTWVGSKGMDSDGDGLSDAYEATIGTDPRNPDTDDDGLRDGEEVEDYGTDPKDPDTDKGSVKDGLEVRRGSDPLNGDDDVQLDAKVGVAITLEGITFNTGSAEILPESEKTLKKAYYTLYFNPAIEVEIQGHTDNTGGRDLNMKLSQDRADAVRAWLISRGIDEDRMTTKGFGPDQPKATNDTDEGKKQNRRIEFVRTK